MRLSAPPGVARNQNFVSLYIRAFVQGLSADRIAVTMARHYIGPEVRIMSTDEFMFDRFVRDIASRSAYSPEPDR
jgi:hypothetical protein